MPTYLLHGFRWPRPLVRIHIILQNLDDAAAEWLMAPSTTSTLLDNFHTLYPELMVALPNLRFIEQYDPLDESNKSQPFAYVADAVHEVQLGVDIDEIRGRGVPQAAWDALKELRDRIAPGEKLAWFVVVCGDTERLAPPPLALLEQTRSRGSMTGSASGRSGSGSASSGGRGGRPVTAGEDKARPQTQRGFRKWLFGKGERELRKSKSLKDLRSEACLRDSSPPPLPPFPRPGPGTAV